MFKFFEIRNSGVSFSCVLSGNISLSFKEQNFYKNLSLCIPEIGQKNDILTF